jgi:hypothetical protein
MTTGNETNHFLSSLLTQIRRRVYTNFAISVTTQELWDTVPKKLITWDAVTKIVHQFQI